MRPQLVLSLFPGIGLLDLAFEEEGYCTVRGPDVIWGGDIRRFHPPAERFDGVIGGPPCQSFSSLVHLVRANGHEPKFGNLIPEFERCVSEAQPDWFLMENVPKAPDPVIGGYGIHTFMLDNSALDAGDGFGQEQRRLRKFNFGRRGRDPVSLLRWIDLATFSLQDADRTLTQYPVNNSSEAKRRLHSPVLVGHSESSESLTAHKKERMRRRTAVLSTTSEVPVKIGGSGKVKSTAKKAVTSSAGGRAEDVTLNNSRRYKLADALRLQGLPENHLDDCPFTAEGKLKAVANGVPVMMGRAIARAIKEAISA